MHRFKLGADGVSLAPDDVHGQVAPPGRLAKRPALEQMHLRDRASAVGPPPAVREDEAEHRAAQVRHELTHAPAHGARVHADERGELRCRHAAVVETLNDRSIGRSEEQRAMQDPVVIASLLGPLVDQHAAPGVILRIP